MIHSAREVSALLKPASERTIARLSLYRRILDGLRQEGVERVYSHELASRSGATAAQVRRDLMSLQVYGRPNRGYEVPALHDAIVAVLDPAEPQAAALVGVGNLGRAVLAFFHGRRPKFAFTAAFDTDPDKAGRVIHGCHCYPVADLPGVVQAEGIHVAALTVPAAAAQAVADQLVLAGVRSIVNFAPVPLYVPAGTFVEDVDLTTTLEKAAYYARKQAEPRSER